jgi:importin subunit alpha-6/7
MNRSRQEERKQDFKKSIAVDDLRRRRDSDTLQLRKSKREESLMKRRNANASPVPPTRNTAHSLSSVTSTTSSSTSSTSFEASTASGSAAEAALAALNNPAQLQELLARFNGNELGAALAATTQLRRMLSIEKDPPIDHVLSLDVLPRLVQYVALGAVTPGQTVPPEQLQLAFEAAWAVTNIASGHSEATHAVVNAGAIPVFVNLLACADENVSFVFVFFFGFLNFFEFFSNGFFLKNQLRDQCVWALGNIAGDGPMLRELCLDANVMDALLYQFTLEPSQGLTRNTTWAVSNLCRGKPAPKFERVSHCISALSFLLRSADKETTIDAAWALSYLTDGDDVKIQAVIDANVCEPLVRMLAHPDNAVKTPALRAVGNIVTGNASQTQAIVDLQPFGALAQMLQSNKKSIVKEACWTLSNITAGTDKQIQAVIDANLMSLLAEKMEQGDFDVKKEACWAVSNATTGGTAAQTRQFVNSKVIDALVAMAGTSDTKIVLVALEALENILKAGEPDGKKQMTDNVFADWFEEAGGVDLLEDLQDHKNEVVYQRAVTMLETFFQGEAVEADENVAPNHNHNKLAVGAPATFAFGISNANKSANSFAF